MTIVRVPIQRRELDAAIEGEPDTVVRRAAQAMAALLDGSTVVVEERIGELPGGEELFEETTLSVDLPS